METQNTPLVLDAPKPFKPYKVTCRVTDLEKKTNPKQFFKTADLVGVSPEVLHGSYVSREGRKELVGLTADEAVAKYGLNPVVAAWAVPAPAPVPSPEAPVAPEGVEVDPEVEAPVVAPEVASAVAEVADEVAEVADEVESDINYPCLAD